MINKIMLACEEANHVCDKTQYKEASFLEKIKLNIHVLFCKACKKYTKNNTKLTKTIRKSNIEYLDKKYKNLMKEKFKKALKEELNQQNNNNKTSHKTGNPSTKNEL